VKVHDQRAVDAHELAPLEHLLEHVRYNVGLPCDVHARIITMRFDPVDVVDIDNYGAGDRALRLRQDGTGP
jgi:hypothetical protein